MVHNILIFVAFVLLFPVAASAEKLGPKPQTAFAAPVDKPKETLFGLSMHGQPKYSASDKHLDYVNTNAPQGGTLKTAAIGTFDTLNPFSLKGRSAQGLDLVYDRLMARVWDEPFTMYPLIAERVEVAKDRSSITFYLNPKARFHDGSPITQDDVIFTFETLKTEGRPNMRRVYKLVSKVEKRGTNGIHFALSAEHDQETVMILAMMPVLSKKDWAGKTFDSTTLTPPLGSGPYKIAQFEPGRRIVYERVKDYWGNNLLTAKGHFNFDKIIYDYYRDDTVAFEAFKSGDLNLRRELDSGQWAMGYDFPAVQNKKIEMQAIAHGRPERTRALIFNTRRAPFNDLRVRKALSLLFDFEWANQNMYHGQYKRITSYFPNSELAAAGEPSPEEMTLLEPFIDKIPAEVFGPLPQPATNKDSAQRRENLKEADRLLKSAGWNVVDGKRMKDGQQFKFEILLDAPEEEKLALHFKRSLQRVGILAQVRVMDAAAYRGRLNEYDFDMTMYFWLSTLSPGTEQILYWGCDAANEPGRWNYAGICNPAIDALAKGVAATKNREDLLNHMHALDRLLVSGYYAIPLYYAGTDNIAYWRPLNRPQKTPLYGVVLETWWMDQTKPAKPIEPPKQP